MRKLANLSLLLLALMSSPRAVAQSLDADWEEIDPREIQVNPVKLFADDWMILSAGQRDSTMNMMTIAWGGLGELWGRPVATVYVSTSRYTYQFMEGNDYFTLTGFPQAYTSAMQFLGTQSGRKVDKVKGSGLTVQYTEAGNPIYKEANLAIECKKIYSAPFQPERMPKEQLKWHEDTNTGIHVMYIGEIVHAWRKKP